MEDSTNADVALRTGWRTTLRYDNDPRSAMLVPTGKALGAEVLGVDLTQPVGEALGEWLREAWARHLVLLFRGQALSPAELVAAASIFGTPEVPASVRHYEAQGLTPPDSVHRNILIVSNLDDEGRPVARNSGLGSGEVVWHSDNSYVDRPPSASMLHGIEVPPQGGDTWFSNQYLAYLALPDEVRARIRGLGAVHDSSRNSAGVLRPGVAAPVTLADVPGPVHPLVRRHPITGQPALYLGRRRAAPSQYIPGMAPDESDRLLDVLWTHASDGRFAWAHQWQAGDIVLWDNRCAMHRRDPHDPRFPRIMRRVQLSGDRPERYPGPLSESLA